MVCWPRLVFGLWVCYETPDSGILLSQSTALLQCAAIAIWVYSTFSYLTADVIPPTNSSSYIITNIYTFYDYSFALCCGSVGWCFIVMTSYIAGLRAKAKLQMARNSVGPSAPEMEGKGNVSKTAAWVV